MTEHQALRGVDWWHVIVDLERKGLSHREISLSIGIPRTTVLGWKNRDAEPRHEDGERLLSLWCKAIAAPRELAPRK